MRLAVLLSTVLVSQTVHSFVIEWPFPFIHEEHQVPELIVEKPAEAPTPSLDEISSYPTGINSGAYESLCATPSPLELPTTFDSFAPPAGCGPPKDRNFSTQELYEHAELFASWLQFPNTFNQTCQIESSFLAENITGRVDVTRMFVGRELNTEYLFGLFSTMSDDTDKIVDFLGYAVSHEIYQFSGNQDQYNMGVIFHAKFNMFSEVIPFDFNLWVKLNEKKEVVQYDLKFGRWPLFYDYIVKKAATLITSVPYDYRLPLDNSITDVVAPAMAQSVCYVHETYCDTAENRQYNSTEECMDILVNQTRFGQSMEGGRNTILCRLLHQNMVALRPDVHCAHIGPSGGDMCVDEDIVEYVNVTLNYPNQFPEVFIGINQTECELNYKDYSYFENATIPGNFFSAPSTTTEMLLSFSS